MSNEKRYYWLKLKEDFFSSKRIKKLRKMAGGDTYTIIYLKMQLKALKTEGVLEFTGLEEDFADELALDIDEKPEDVKMTLAYLMSCELVETSDNVDFYLPFVIENTGSESAHTIRQRNYIQRKKEQQASLNDANVTQKRQIGDGEKEIEKEKEKDIRQRIVPLFEDNGLTNEEFNEKYRLFIAEYPKDDYAQQALIELARIIQDDTDGNIFTSVMSSLVAYKDSEAWNEENGRYIPKPAKWLSTGQWKKTPKPKQKSFDELIDGL